MNHLQEFMESSIRANVQCYELSEREAEKYIGEVIRKFHPDKLSGHLSIGHESTSIALEPWEFSYSKKLKDEPLFIFFEQRDVNKNKMACIKNGKKLCSILEQAYGMEYFVTNQNVSFLLAVNWYEIEGIGEITNLINELNKSSPDE
ncbi:hypothetical protein [Endozoicomonas numazuensis]|uniref:hypothetical protein n=1 Tax=Endozoicomonas numazuensis TaxID=1137799 RepID=UPI00191C3C78|nr:hypothetical protein [Endozoicomonas numazuensis]